MKDKYVELYMDFAERVAQLSYAERKKVGAVIVNDDTIVYGYNGTPAGWDNCCESKQYMDIDAGGWLSPDEIYEQWPLEDADGRRYRLKTKPEVLHAEMNALSKIARTTVSSTGATLFVTLAPCIECAKAIYQAGVSKVIYSNDYRSSDGVDFLKKCGIEVIKASRDK